MSPEDKKELLDAIETKIEKTVNGHIRDLDSKLDKHIENTEKYRTEMYAFMARLEPVSQGLITFQNVIRFCKFVGIPTTALLAAAYWLIRRI